MDVTSGVVIAIATIGYVIVTYFMYQNLRQQTAYIARQTDAGEAQLNAATIQAETARMGMMQTVFNLMEACRPARTALREYANARRNQGLSADTIPFDNTIDPAIKDHASTVCRAYDFLGFLDRHRHLPAEIVDEFYAPPLVLLWEQVLGKYVEDQRRPTSDGGRGPTHFRELNELYKRVRCVEQNHPAKLNQSSWPANPRECR